MSIVRRECPPARGLGAKSKDGWVLLHIKGHHNVKVPKTLSPLEPSVSQMLAVIGSCRTKNLLCVTYNRNLSQIYALSHLT